MQLPPSGKPGNSQSAGQSAKQSTNTSAQASVARVQQALAKLTGQVTKAEVVGVESRAGSTPVDTTGKLLNQQLGNLQQNNQQQAQLRLDQTTQNTMNTLLRLNSAGSTEKASTMPYQATLRIGQLAIQVSSPIALQVGEQILLKVLNSGELTLLSKPETLRQPATAQQQQTSSTAALQTALRALLPRLNSESRLLEALQQLRPAQLQLFSAQNQSAIAALRQLHLPLASVSRSLDTPGAQTQLANTIKQALQRSGIFQQSLGAAGGSKNADTGLVSLTNSTLGKSAESTPSGYKLPELIRQSIASWVNDKSPFKTTSSDITHTLAKAADKNPQALLKAATQTSSATLKSADSLKASTQELSQQLLAELLTIATGNKTAQREVAKFPGDLSSQLKRAAEVLRQQSASTLPTKDAQKLPAAQREQSLLMLSLLRESLSTLVRTQLHQLTSLNMQQQTPEAQQHNHWFTEIPVHVGEHTHNVQIQLDEESRHQQHQGQRQWKVMLRFDLERLGALFVRLILVGDSVKTTLWTETDLSQRFIRRQLDELEQRLKTVGVNVETIECLCGTPPDPRIQIQQSLIDITT